MNRIYQGRVSSVQIANPDPAAREETPWVPLPDWQGSLWRHHELFQDAVNYYIVALLALANGDTEKTHQLVELRDRLTCEPNPSQPDYEKALHFYIWGNFQRRGKRRFGLRASVAKYLTPGNDAPSFAECAQAVLAGNSYTQTPEGRTLLDRGLAQLLGKCKGESGCRNSSKEYLPRLCRTKTCCNYPDSAIARRRQYQDELLPFLLHSAKSAGDPLLSAINVFSVALPDFELPRLVGDKAKRMLGEMLADWREHLPDSAPDFDRLAAHLENLPANFAMPGYAATSAKGTKRFRLYAMYFFRYLERSDFTLGLLRSTTPTPKPNDLRPEPPSRQELADGDPIQRTRGLRGYVFSAFTALTCWEPIDAGEPSWLKFDEAALQEALKTLHQVESKNEERQKEAEFKEARRKYQRGETKKLKTDISGDEGERPPILAGDPRITRLVQLVDEELKAEYEMSEGVEVQYGLHPRTIRGFRDIRKKWNAALAPGEVYSEAQKEKLVAILTAYKIENTKTMGSPVLIDELVKENNWVIWREPTAEQMESWRKAAKLTEDMHFADDPLQALTDERELIAEIESLKLPVRLTPADPEHSRRQFYFSDVSALDKMGRMRHNQNWVEVEVAVERSGKLVVDWVRIHFTAPRLQRDQLTTAGAGTSFWQQAMMTALNLKMPLTKNGMAATFESCAAVALMPEVTASREKRILLNFPITLEAEAIAKQLGKAARWDALQFGGADKESYWLRWPKTWIDEKKERKKAPPPPWWKHSQPWRCLAVDLGQRDAGAFAVLEASPGNQPKEQSRKLGVAEGTTWWATVRAMGSLRLPGEDARVWRNGAQQEELYGERGRNLAADEWEEAKTTCRNLGFDPDKLLGTDARRYSFPELNDQLLYALRRAQTRLARLQSWSCLAHEPEDEKKRIAFSKRRTRIAEQLAEAVADLTKPVTGQELPERSAWLSEISPLLEKKAWPAIAGRIMREIEAERTCIQRELVRIADRIQPLRGRCWEWSKREDGVNYRLRRTEPGTDDRKKLLAGQRGLSIERIEQLESLRQRCQSFNRALRQTPGEPANLGRSKRGIELPDPCPELLDRLEALKEQRVNQTAHLILAQALGVRLKAHTTDEATRLARDIHGEYERIPGREPVDFLVLENLDRYLASQGRSKAENSRLMKWCHRAILGKLKQLCEPYGLRVVETPAAYSSQFCSLTGVAGFRAVELTPDSENDYRWKKHLDRLRDAAEGKRKLDPAERRESEIVKTLFDELRRLNHDLLVQRDQARTEGRAFRPKWRTLLAPVAGGPIFVPLRGRPMQADLNAAINIGLRAIAAPDVRDIHVRIRAKREKDGFVVRADNAREKARWGNQPPAIAVTKQSDRNKLLTEAHLNFFTDPNHIAAYDHAHIAGEPGYSSGRGISGTIKGGDHHIGKNWLRCGTLNNDRLAAAKLGRPLVQEPNPPADEQDVRY